LFFPPPGFSLQHYMDKWVVPLDLYCLIYDNFMVRKFVLVWDPPILAVECGENKLTPDMLLQVNSIISRYTRHRYQLCMWGNLF
jgi:hypothetical protein